MVISKEVCDMKSIISAFMILWVCLGLTACETNPAGTDNPRKNEWQDTFETVWQTVNDKYFDPSFGGLDWKGVHDRYQPQIAAVEDEETFYKLINTMLFELNVSHIAVVPPEDKEQLEPILSAELSKIFDTQKPRLAKPR